MYCSRCGGITDSQAVFCGHCGVRIPSASLPSIDSTGWLPVENPVGTARSTHGRRQLALIGLIAMVVAAAATGIVLLTHRSGSTAGAASGSPAVVAAASPSAPSQAISTVTTTVTPSTSHPATTSRSAAPATPPAPTADFAALYKKQQSGVVRIETISCSDSGVGTGFLLSPTLIATVDHVVAQSAVVSLITGTERATGTVIGSDPSLDLALVRSDRPLTGYQFHFATTLPSIGDPVAAIGFPIGDPITLTHGDISGLDRAITIEGITRTGLIETDTPVNPGNSGGPLIAADGSVVGLVDALRTDANGIAYAVPATQARVADSQWAASPAPQPPATCQNPLGPSQQPQNIAPAPGGGSVAPEQLNGIMATLNIYFGGIDTGNYAAAYSVQGPSQQSSAGVEGFAAGLLTSYDSNIVLFGAESTGEGSIAADVSFNSIQLPSYGPDGDSCDNWTLTFRMIEASDGTWLMDGADPYNGSTHTTC